MRESHHYHQSNASGNLISVGDVVVTHDSEQLRGFWRLGRVQELLCGQDGRVRGAKLRVARKGQYSTLHRPLQLLYLLEINTSGNSSKEVTTGTQDPPAPNEVKDSKPIAS